MATRRTTRWLPRGNGGCVRDLRPPAGRVRRYCLPPSCPTENHIERAWLDLHANITRNHRHADIDALVEAVHASLTARTIAIPHLRLAACSRITETD